VRIELHRGAFVTTISPATVRDHYALYGTICGFAASRALTRGAPDLAGRLRKISDAVGRTDDGLEISSMSVEYHRTVLDEAGNPRLGLLIKSLSVMVPGAFFAQVPRAIPLQKRGLAAISRAVRSGDGEAAKARYLDVMEQVGEKVVDLFDARGLFG
jgi:DNA-binding GntR family transcriptional regulator